MSSDIRSSESNDVGEDVLTVDDPVPPGHGCIVAFSVLRLASCAVLAFMKVTKTVNSANTIVRVFMDVKTPFVTW